MIWFKRCLVHRMHILWCGSHWQYRQTLKLLSDNTYNIAALGIILNLQAF